MTDAIAGLDPVLKFIAALGAAVLVLAGLWRWLVPRVRNVKEDARAIRDTLVGREAIRDSITGREIEPAIPGIGSRMADQEQDVRGIRNDVGVLTRAVADLASAQADMSVIQARMDDHDRRISDNDRRLTLIEQAPFYERMAGKAESVAMFRAMEAIAKDEPVDPDDD